MSAVKGNVVRFAIALSAIWLALGAFGAPADAEIGAPAVTSAASAPINYTSADTTANLTLALSAKEIHIGETLSINVTCNTTEPLQYNEVTLIVSNRDTGNVVLYMHQNLTTEANLTYIYYGVKYELNAFIDYIPYRGVTFGTYTVWATVYNVSAFEDFKIVPSIEDLYNDLAKIRLDNERADSQYWFVIKFLFPSAIIMCGVVMLFSYWQWRMPNPDKKDIKDWLLSKVDQVKVQRLVNDVRDINRKAFAQRAGPAVGKNDQAIRALRLKRNALEDFAKSIDKKTAKFEERTKVAQEFSKALNDTVVAIDKEMAEREIETEKALQMLEVETRQVNRRDVPVDRRVKTRPDMDRLKALLESRGERK